MLPDSSRSRCSQKSFAPRWFLVLFFLAAAGLSTGPLFGQTVPAVASTDAAKYLDDIKALSAPAMEGRGDGSKGLTLAEHLIVARYRALGLEPAGKKEYLQPFRVVTGRRILPGSKMSGQANGEKSQFYALNDDFIPLAFSSTGNAK